jgi:hypothetical protein
MKTISAFAAMFLAAGLFVSGCNYDVSLTAKPTRKIDPQLIGDWVAVDKDSKEEDQMHVRKLDDVTYVVSMDKDIYRAFHSDFAGTAFLSVQDLNSSERLYLNLTYKLSPDGSQLSVFTVSTKVVPEETKGRAALQKLIKQQLKNPKLFNEPMVFTRKIR